MITEAQLIEKLSSLADPLERRLAFCALLARAMKDMGFLEPVIVGGHAVEFYTAGGYTTTDVDLVAASEALEQILPNWGFRHLGRHWIHDDLGIAVEAPGSRLEGDRERVTEVATSAGAAYIIGLEDLIIDRICAFAHWQSEADRQWAALLLRLFRNRIDVGYLRQRAKLYDVAEEVEKLLEETSQ